MEDIAAIKAKRIAKVDDDSIAKVNSLYHASPFIWPPRITLNLMNF
jgi:hypothetical protein